MDAGVSSVNVVFMMSKVVPVLPVLSTELLPDS